ncbi:MAG: hypothetical protein RBR22_01310 [Desulfuromonas sp.]|nr:hypothetical protein [Desulfuromonas sp.]
MNSAQQTQMQNMFITMFDMPAGGWLDIADDAITLGLTVEQIADALTTTEVFTAIYPSDDTFAADLLDSVMGDTAAADDKAALAVAIDDLLAAGWSKGQVVIALGDLLAVADVADATWGAAAQQFQNKVAVAEYYDTEGGASTDVAELQAFVDDVTDSAATLTEAYAEVDDALASPVEPSVPGDEFMLTSSTDMLDGTVNDDDFYAYIQQNSFAGGVSNSLSSADHLDGGAGTDSLYAELVPEFRGATAFNTNAVQPRTTSIENVTFEARDAGGYINNVTVDAKYMTDIDSIGSYMSDGDLVIENLTTLTSTGALRNTSEITVTMDHTDNFNSDDDASDLTVLFDEDYLLSGQETGGAALTIRMLNAFNNVQGENPIEGFETIVFTVGDTKITVDVQDIAADDTLDYTTAYTAVVDAINAQLVADGFPDVTAAVAVIEPAVFSIPVSTYVTGDSAGQYFPIVVSNAGPEALTGVEIQQSQLNYDTDMNNSFQALAAVTEDTPVTVNVELEKVGRDGEGGNLVIGGKDWQSDHDYYDTDYDQVNGIEVINISVLGDEDKPSNLGYISSTDSALKTVNISTADTTLDSFASLTIRDAFQDGGDFDNDNDLDTVNANSFLGDLIIGVEDEAMNIDTFTATGGGDVTLYETIGASNTSFASLNANAYTVTTGAGSDDLDISAYSGAQLTVTSGTGNDSIDVSINGADFSGSDLTFADINSSGGNNTVTTTSTDSDHSADIDLGGGADTVYGNSVNITVDTNAGNDVIYADNTGDKISVTATEQALLDTLGTSESVAFGLGREIRVTLSYEAEQATGDAIAFVDGFEATADIEPADGFLTTALDYYQAVANAINNDSVMSELAVASIDSNGALTMTSLVDGYIPHITVETASEVLFDDLTSTQQKGILAELQELSNDSTITLTDAAILYAQGLTIDGDGLVLIDHVLGSDSDSETSSYGNNVVNGGLGDDVIVLSSDVADDESFDTVVFDADAIGNDTIVHFQDGADGDVLDFTDWLDNLTSLSGSSVSQVRIDTTLASDDFAANTVTVVNFSAIDTTDIATWSELLSASSSELLEFVDEDNSYDSAIETATAPELAVVEATQHSILLVQNDDNLGEYAVFQVVSDTDTIDIDSVQLIGTVDFGDEQSFDVSNFA